MMNAAKLLFLKHLW